MVLSKVWVLAGLNATTNLLTVLCNNGGISCKMAFFVTGVSIATFLIGFAISVEIACNKLLDRPHPYWFLIGCVHGWFHHYCTHYLSEGREALQANGTTCRLPQSLQGGFDDVPIGVP